MNFSLLVDALVAAKLQGVSRRMTELVLQTLCSPRDAPAETVTISDCHHDCIFRECCRCRFVLFKQRLLEANPDFNFRQNVAWHQWVTKEDQETGKCHNCHKVLYHDSVFKLLDVFGACVTTQSKHLFHFHWQGHQFELIRQNLKPGQLLMVMDFTQNYEHKQADKPQSSHWHHRQTTMHPNVAYFICPNASCGLQWKEDLMMLTEDREHCSWAVKAFEDWAFEYLEKEVGLKITRIIELTDNCAAQYKSRAPFQIISEHPFPLEIHYFGQWHGKGPGDAAIGRLKRQLDDRQRIEQCDIGDTLSMWEYCVESLCPEKLVGVLPSPKCILLVERYRPFNRGEG